MNKHVDNGEVSTGKAQNKSPTLGLLITAGTITLFVFLSWLVLFPFRGLPFLGNYARFFGKNPVVHVLLVATFSVYFFLYFTSARKAKTSAKVALSSIKSNVLNVIGALLIAGATVELLPEELVGELLGQQAGITAVFAGLGIGAFLPACPFVSYPIIAALYSSGASFSGGMAMLFSSGLVFACNLSGDLIHFDGKIMSLRVGLAFTGASLASFAVYFSGISL